MVKIRMTRFGRHKLPFYRIVVMDSRIKRDGGYIDLVGTYEPFKGVLKLDEEIALKYLRLGAQPSDSVKVFLKNKGIWKKFMDQKLANKKANDSKKTKKPSQKKKVSSKKVENKKKLESNKKSTNKKVDDSKKANDKLNNK